MNHVNAIMAHLTKLPTSRQTEVLDYVEFLEQKISKKNSDDENFSHFSLTNALKGMEDDKLEYHLSDIKEK